MLLTHKTIFDIRGSCEPDYEPDAPQCVECGSYVEEDSYYYELPKGQIFCCDCKDAAMQAIGELYQYEYEKQYHSPEYYADDYEE